LDPHEIGLSATCVSFGPSVAHLVEILDHHVEHHLATLSTSHVLEGAAHVLGIAANETALVGVGALQALLLALVKLGSTLKSLLSTAKCTALLTPSEGRATLSAGAERGGVLPAALLAVDDALLIITLELPAGFRDPEQATPDQSQHRS
jgi:hypothetical protein